MNGRRQAAAVAAAVAVLTACTAGPTSQASPTPAPPTQAPDRSVTTSPPAPAPPSRRPTASPSAAPRRTPDPPAPTPSEPPAFRVAPVLADIERLAGDIGPREATSEGFAEAADLVERRLERLGYRARRTRVDVPAGVSWGVPVDAGRSANVIAEWPGFDPRRAHVVIGAHLDTVPQAPGAEDNASGVAVLLELARLAGQQPPETPVQFIAFGAEEPRGEGDARHHFGSQQYVADLPRSHRRAVQAMVSLDRVGVRAGFVPVCRAEAGGTELRAELRRTARRIDIVTRACGNRSSDHWSYAKAGVPAVRLGSVPYAGYHSPGDVPEVVDRHQLLRVGRVVWAWLRG